MNREGVLPRSLLSRYERTHETVGEWVLTVEDSPDICDRCKERISTGCACYVFLPREIQYLHLACRDCYREYYKKPHNYPFHHKEEENGE